MMDQSCNKEREKKERYFFQQHMSEAFIINFLDDLNSISPVMVGGKAYALNTLYHKKFSVPKGFVITTYAFDRYLQLLGLDTKCILSQILLKNNSFSLIPEIQQKIVSGDMPSDIVEAIRCSLDMLGVPLVAVRSSATMEDGEQRSYAGQFESFLNVSGENIFRQVKMCWSSFFSSRAMVYSKNRFYDGKMAVLIQEMIQADVSGVCFSVNPIDCNRNTVTIELASGTGDKLVQGTVTPDRFIVSKNPLTIQEKHIVSDIIIPDDIIEKVTRAVIEIENLYQKPMDMEFAVKDGHLHILQARPITALNRI
jgi:pyruvate,water dikinase